MDNLKNEAGKSNLVLGCGVDYSPDQLMPFVFSLRNSGYEGELALVVYSDQLTILAGLARRFSVTLVPIEREPKWLPSRIGSRLQNQGRMRRVQSGLGRILPPLLRSPGFLALAGRHLHYFFQIVSSRFFPYYSYLHQNRESYSHVLLTDVRDVIFQGDPFLYSHSKSLCCFMDPLCLGDEPLNPEWMKKTFGDTYCSSRLGRQISCAGTILGDASSMLIYLQKMCVEIMRTLSKNPDFFGVDQAVHNFLIWEGKLPGVLLCENGRHAVMTLKNADITAFRMDEEGRLLNLDGNPAPVLHQYDFHPELRAHLRKLQQHIGG